MNFIFFAEKRIHTIHKIITEIFYFVEEFYKLFEIELERNLLSSQIRKRKSTRNPDLSIILEHNNSVDAYMAHKFLQMGFSRNIKPNHKQKNYFKSSLAKN